MNRWYRCRATCLLTTRLLPWSPWSSRNKRPRWPSPLTLPLSLSSCLTSSRWQVFFLNLQTFESIFWSCFYFIMPPCLHYDFEFLWLFFLSHFCQWNGHEGYSKSITEYLSAGHSCFCSSIILEISHVSFFWSSSGIVIFVQCCALELFLELSKMARKKGRKVSFLLLPLNHFLDIIFSC